MAQVCLEHDCCLRSKSLQAGPQAQSPGQGQCHQVTCGIKNPHCQLMHAVREGQRGRDVEGELVVPAQVGCNIFILQSCNACAYVDMHTATAAPEQHNKAADLKAEIGERHPSKSGSKAHPPRCMPMRWPLTNTSASQSTAPKLSSSRCAEGLPAGCAGCCSQPAGTVKLRRYHMRDTPTSERPTPAHVHGERGIMQAMPTACTLQRCMHAGHSTHNVCACTCMQEGTRGVMQRTRQRCLHRKGDDDAPG